MADRYDIDFTNEDGTTQLVPADNGGGAGGASDAITAGTTEVKATPVESAFGGGVQIHDTATANANMVVAFPANFSIYGNTDEDGNGARNAGVEFGGTHLDFYVPTGGIARVNGVEVATGTKLVADAIADGNSSTLAFTGLDLSADANYLIKFMCAQPSGGNVEFQFMHDATVINVSAQGMRLNAGTISSATINYVGHQSIGVGFGHFDVFATPNGSVGYTASINIANQSVYTQYGLDSAWFSGGMSMNGFRLINQTGNIPIGTRVRIYRVS